MRKKWGRTIVYLLVVITVSLWIMSKDSTVELVDSPLRSIAQITALIGAVFFSVDSILAARFSFIEKLFGGLDKVYRFHYISGVVSIIALTIHPTALIIDALPNTDLAKMYILPNSAVTAYNFGILALYGLIVLIGITLFVKLPYNLWKFTHRFMGFVVAFSVLHVFLVSSDTSNFMPLRIWVLGLMTIAFGLAVYKRLFYDSIAKKNSYVVEEIVTDTKFIDIILKPTTRNKLKFQSGQFIFVSFDSQKVSDEQHPFTISSSPDEENIRLSIKPDGDYTYTLFGLQKGERATIYGPYGNFSEFVFNSGNKEMVWIAGGIGITPFLSFLRDSNVSKLEKEINFYYCARDVSELRYDSEIRDLISERGLKINYVQYCSTDKGRLGSKVVLSELKYAHETDILMCGPIQMLKDLESQFVAEGVPISNIAYEEFNFKP